MKSVRLEQGEEHKQGTTFSYRILVVFSLVVICIQALGGVLMWCLIDGWAARSSFGEMFGAVDALFSGLAFAGVIYTILLQRRELELQRGEIEMTRKELEQSLHKQEQSQRILADQTEALKLTAQLNALSIVPAMNCGVHVQDGKMFLTLVNSGDTPAFDVDVLSIALYHEDDMDIPTFLSNYVRKDCPHSRRLFENENQFYGVYDHLVYAIFPQRRKVIARFHFPLRSEFVYVLLQFRDARGNNYHYLYWFAEGQGLNEVDDMSYRLGGLHPTTPRIVSRINFELNSMELVTADGTPLPSYLDSEFVGYWDSSVPSGYTTRDYQGVEDRGRWLAA